MPFIKGLNNPVFYPTNGVPNIYASGPVSTGAGHITTAQEDGNGEYIYYLNSAGFFAISKYTDSAKRLSMPRIAPAAGSAMTYTSRRGFHASILSATSTTVTLPSLGRSLDGSSFFIDKGTGKGQRRTLTFVSETTHDFGMLTGTSTSSITDNTKKWAVNQWAGYMVKITFGTGQSEWRKVLYNSVDTLTFFDANLLPQNSWDNQIFTATHPFAVPVTTAALQAHFEIASATYSVDTAWDITPNTTSWGYTNTGGIFLLSTQAAAPFINMQYYDVAHDIWVQKTVPQSMINGVATDWTIERCLRGTPHVSRTATGGTLRSLVDSGAGMTLDRYRNFRIEMKKGTEFCSRRIVGNNATTFFFNKDADFTIDNTVTYEVTNDYNKVFIGLGGSAGIMAYNTEFDTTHRGEYFDNGICNASFARIGSNWEVFSISTGTRIASGMRAVNGTPTAGGTGYTMGDILTVTTGGNGGQVIVTGLAPGGVVTSVELYHTGTTTGYTVGTGRATTGGTGTGCTIEITQVGATGLVTTHTNHFIKKGMTVTIGGASDANWNTNYVVLATPAVNTFCIALTATGNLAGSATQSTTTIVDTSANWVPNEHAGKIVNLTGNGVAPTSQIRWIISNTSNTLTVSTITAGGNGSSKYTIYDSKVYGVDNQYKDDARKGYGWATSGTTTTLVDTTKTWIPNQWAGYRMQIDCGTGFGSTPLLITSNTTNTLTFATQTFTPDNTTAYTIQDTFGLATASTTTSITETGTKNWIVNQFAGKRGMIIAGTGVGQEFTISGNTANALTTGTITAGDATSVYAIYGARARGNGIEINLNWGVSDVSIRGKHLLIPQGGGSRVIEYFDITTSRYIYNLRSDSAEAVNTGAYWAYDGGDWMYFSVPTANARPNLYRYNLVNHKVEPAGQINILDGTLAIGNRMEIVNAGTEKILWYYANGSVMGAKGVLNYLP